MKDKKQKQDTPQKITKMSTQPIRKMSQLRYMVPLRTFCGVPHQLLGEISFADPENQLIVFNPVNL